MRDVHQIALGDFAATIERKDIRNIHLSVHPPDGAVRVSAPRHLSVDHLRAYVISKLDWIKQQRRQIQAQERESPREFTERESHYLWGKRYLLTLEEGSPGVELRPRKMILSARTGSSQEKRESILEGWYRGELRREAESMVERWARTMGVEVKTVFIQRMKTKWGSCNPARRTIRLNTELAKKPKECLEYLVVHELAHLIEPTHNERFVSLMDHYLPAWRERRQALNRLPVRHEQWRY
ncbi:M48 family metallopeptidase [Haloferula sargassicola]|uniref:YgjP-like metallopeptidase domain-containing protein n=1 Tax=Haloferula sargassicola TaxID=490096 RepID=A0ABP9UQM8_9BACT